jgi:hypothetical protein
MKSTFLIISIFCALFSGVGRVVAESGGDDGALVDGADVTLPAEVIFAGPWGTLLTRRLVIEPPEAVVDVALWEQASAVWFFPRHTVEGVEGLFRGAGMKPEVVDRLMAGVRGWEAGSGVVVYPPDGVLVRLPTSVRTRVYLELGRDAQNRMYRDPLWIPSEDLSYWLDDRVLDLDAAGCLQDLLYAHNGFWLLSDVDVLLRCVEREEDRRRLLRLVLRQASTQAAVRVPGEEAVEGMARYWRFPAGAERENAALRERLIEAARSGRVIPVEELLPPAMAGRLGRYLVETSDVFRDCHWTAMNFFEAEADDRYLDPAVIRGSLTSDYVRVDGQVVSPEFGDLLLFRDAQQQVVHSCNYVAGNLVFTKNGGADERPWVLMPIDEVRSLYSFHRPVEVHIFRRIDRLLQAQGE